MNRNAIRNIIADLAKSQGFYGRILRSIIEIEENDPARAEALWEELEAQNFQSPIDLVFFFEC